MSDREQDKRRLAMKQHQQAKQHSTAHDEDGAPILEAPREPTKLGREHEIRSPAVQDILGAVPNWILKWGITVVFFAVFLVVLGAWFVRYPEIIKARIVVTTANPPAPVVARTSGELALLVEDHAFVAKGDHLAVIRNPARLDDVLMLKEALDHVQPLIEQEAPQIDFSFHADALLGDLQTAYSAFLQRLRTYVSFNATGYHAQSIRFLKQQVQDYHDLSIQLQRSKELTEREVILAQRKLEANRELLDTSHPSNVARLESELTFLRQQQALESVNASLLYTTIQQAQQQRAIFDVQYQYDEQKRTHTNALHTAYEQLRSRLRAWEERFLLKAPIDGQVSFFTFWGENQSVMENTEVMIVVPTRSSDDALVGKVSLPRPGSGRVETGQPVHIKFDKYSFNDFGAVVGRVESISLLAREDQFAVEVRLPDGLKTTHGQTLDFTHNIQGTAEIITENLRVIERIFNQFRSIF